MPAITDHGNTNSRPQLATPPRSQPRITGGQQFVTPRTPTRAAVDFGTIPGANRTPKSLDSQQPAEPLYGPVAAIRDIIDNMAYWDKSELARRLQHARIQAGKQAAELERAREVAHNLMRARGLINQSPRDGNPRADYSHHTGVEQMAPSKAEKDQEAIDSVSSRARLARERIMKHRVRRGRKEVGQEQQREDSHRRSTELQMLEDGYNGSGPIYKRQRGIQVQPKNGLRLVNGMGSVVAAINPGHDLRWPCGRELSWQLNRQSPLYAWRSAARLSVRSENEVLESSPYVYKAVHAEEKEAAVAAVNQGERDQGMAWLQDRAGTPGEMGETPFSPLPPINLQAEVTEVPVGSTAHDNTGVYGGPSDLVKLPEFDDGDIFNLDDLEPMTFDEAQNGQRKDGGGANLHSFISPAVYTTNFVEKYSPGLRTPGESQIKATSSHRRHRHEPLSSRLRPETSSLRPAGYSDFVAPRVNVATPSITITDTDSDDNFLVPSSGSSNTMELVHEQTTSRTPPPVSADGTANLAATSDPKISENGRDIMCQTENISGLSIEMRKVLARLSSRISDPPKEWREMQQRETIRGEPGIGLEEFRRLVRLCLVGVELKEFHEMIEHELGRLETRQDGKYESKGINNYKGRGGSGRKGKTPGRCGSPDEKSEKKGRKQVIFAEPLEDYPGKNTRARARKRALDTMQESSKGGGGGGGGKRLKGKKS